MFSGKYVDSYIKIKQLGVVTNLLEKVLSKEILFVSVEKSNNVLFVMYNAICIILQ